MRYKKRKHNVFEMSEIPFPGLKVLHISFLDINDHVLDSRQNRSKNVT